MQHTDDTWCAHTQWTKKKNGCEKSALVGDIMVDRRQKPMYIQESDGRVQYYQEKW